MSTKSIGCQLKLLVMSAKSIGYVS